jgi:anti-sigma B factor antagonist
VREARCLRVPDVDATLGRQDFGVDVLPERDAVRVCAVGEIDVATVGGVRDRLDELRAAGCVRLILDLRGVTFLDSTGLRLVIEQVAASATDGCDLAIVPGPWQVQRVFDVAGLSSRLPFVGRSIDQSGARRP